MKLCTECNEKLMERGILNNEGLCADCREFVEKVVENEVNLVSTMNN